MRKGTKRALEDSDSSTAKVPRIEDDPNEIDDEEYEKCVKNLKHEIKRSLPRSSIVKELMDKTKAGRRKWIMSDKPSSAELVQVFPFLRVEKWVRCTLHNIIWQICERETSDMGSWECVKAHRS